jgi:hypothetical protein
MAAATRPDPHRPAVGMGVAINWILTGKGRKASIGEPRELKVA